MFIYPEIISKYIATCSTDTCICGSGKLFKDCCKIMYSKQEYNPKQLMHESIKQFGSKKICMFNQYDKNCSGDIIKAHSISQKYLSYISNEGHVLSFMKNINASTIDETFDIGSLPDPQKIGINDVSIFTGLCKHHDNILFSSFEKNEFVYSNEQLLDIHLRTILKEKYAKESALRGINAVKNKRPKNNNSETIAGLHLANYAIGNQLVQKDLQRELDLAVDYKFNNKIVNSLIIEINGSPCVLNSSIVNPAVNLKGELIQDYNDINLFVRSFSFNVIPVDKNKYYYVFIWIKADVIDNYFKMMLDMYSENRLVSLLIQFSFLFSENSAINPLWWKNLSLIKQSRLKKLFWDEITSIITPSQFYSKLRTNIDFNEAKLGEIRLTPAST